MAAGRGRTLAVMAHETGKTVREGDPEVSEAIDFADVGGSVHHESSTSWPPTASPPTRSASCSSPGRGTSRRRSRPTASSPPSPPATPSSSSRHPRPSPRPSSWSATSTRPACPTDVVQLVRCPDDDVGRHLVTHPGVDGVVLTGSYDTARLFLGWRPDLRLLAETSGKNALVISQTADVDLALRDLVRSAFGHAGQKCSAASLAIVEAPLYDDPTFRRRLADAVRSLRVGPATDLATMVGPVITAPSGPLARALTTLDDGESWLVEPRRIDGAACGRRACASASAPGRGSTTPSASGRCSA